MSGIRTFNTAKRFAEEVLHPLIQDHKDANKKSKLGANNEDEASKLSKTQRIIKRFNGLKERLAICQSLLTEIESTIRINDVGYQIEQLDDIALRLKQLDINIRTEQDSIITFKNSNGVKTPVLTPLFDDCCGYLDEIYPMIQTLMTRNKLLFFGDDDDMLEDQELKDRIKMDNRRA